MSTPTPGPWYVDKGTDIALSDHVESSALAKVYARVICVDKPVHHSPIRLIPYNDADASLIAACPSLYEYVKEAASAGDAKAIALLKTLALS